jgi:CheY-like chemotaxis protein
VEPQLNVLIVEDNFNAADSLAALVRHWGYQVRVAYDGDTALEMAAQDAPDVVLMDLGLPKLDGVEVTRLMRERLRPKELTFVAITGHSLQEDRCFSAGFKYHLRKPVDLESLQFLLATVSSGDTLFPLEGPEVLAPPDLPNGHPPLPTEPRAPRP